jgi:hypothetical protein
MDWKNCNFLRDMNHMLGGKENYCELKNSIIGVQSCDKEECIFMKMLRETK